MNNQEIIKVLDTEPVEPEDIEWKYINSLAETKQYNALCISVCGRFTWEMVTKRSECGYDTVGKPKSYYFIVGETREFRTMETLVEAYNEKLLWEQNNLLKQGYRVEWKRVIVKDDEEISTISIVAKKGEPFGIKILN